MRRGIDEGSHPAAPASSPYDSPMVSTRALAPRVPVEAYGTTATSSPRQESTDSVSFQASGGSADTGAYAAASIAASANGRLSHGGNTRGGNYAAVPIKPIVSVSGHGGGSAAGEAAPKHVSALCTGLRSKSHDTHICETCSEFWAVNFVDCPRAIVGTSSSSTARSTAAASQPNQNDTADRDQNAPQTSIVIRALIREYQARGIRLPEPVQGQVQFVDALSCALDPASSGRVYPEYYFALCATFGPFDEMISKLTTTVFFRPPDADKAALNPHDKVLQPIQWFHGYASRRDVKRDMSRHNSRVGDVREKSGDGDGSERLLSSLTRSPRIGTYILRFSTNRPGHLTLSWVKASPKQEGKGEFIHTLIQNAGRGFRCIVKDASRTSKNKPSDGSGVAVAAGGMLFRTIGDLLRYHSSRFQFCCRVNSKKTYLRFPEIEEDWLLQSSMLDANSDANNYAAAETGSSAYAAAETGSSAYTAAQAGSRQGGGYAQQRSSDLQADGEYNSRPEQARELDSALGAYAAASVF